MIFVCFLFIFCLFVFVYNSQLSSAIAKDAEYTDQQWIESNLRQSTSTYFLVHSGEFIPKENMPLLFPTAVMACPI